MSINNFDEEKFIKDFVDDYNKVCYDEFIDFDLYLQDFLEIYTDNNNIDKNIIIINHYSNNSFYDAIELFELYYNCKFNFIGSKINYAELTSIILYHNLFDKLLNIIIDDYDSSNDTDED